MRDFDVTFAPPRRWTTRVRVGPGALDALVDDLSSTPPGRLFVLVADDRVAPLHAAPLAQRLRAAGARVELLTFPRGEAHKSRETKAALEDGLVRLEAGGETSIVAVGGGVTGDLAGFLAATWHRGVSLIQVPTSLLAMADAALGGKTAVNLPGGKNLVGSFHQPLALYADVDVLRTLDPEEYREGFGEMVKTAVVADAPLFDRLESEAESLLRLDPAALTRAVEACLRLKGTVVAGDEREAGRRVMLNFGHTVAHALEVASGFAVRHGSAVACGVCVEAALAVQVTGFPAGDVTRIEALLARFGLPTRPPAGLDVEALVAATRLDKKNRAGRVRYALPCRIGAMPAGDVHGVEVDETLLRQYLAGAR